MANPRTRRPRTRRATAQVPEHVLDALEAHRAKLGPPGARPSFAALLRLALERGTPLVTGLPLAPETP